MTTVQLVFETAYVLFSMKFYKDISFRKSNARPDVGTYAVRRNNATWVWHFRSWKWNSKIVIEFYDMPIF